MTPAKDLALQVLSISANPITARDIHDQLKLSTNPRSLSAVRRGLNRLAKLGMAKYDTQQGKRKWTTTGKVPTIVTPATPVRSKGNGGRKSYMCIDPSKPTLNTAIETVLNELVGGQQKFTAHDVTKRLRERVGLDATDPAYLAIDLNETDTVHVAGKQVAKIEHEIVKDAVHELFKQDKLPNYDRVHNGAFWEYMPLSMVPTPSPAPANPDPASSSGSTPPAADGSSYDGNPTL